MGSSISHKFNDSRVLNKIVYHDGMLEVHFNSGAVWRYAGVPTSVVLQLVAATSAGSFFCKNIRGKYTSICVVNAKGEDMGEVCPRAEKIQTPVIVLKLKPGQFLPASHSFSGIIEYDNGDKFWFKEGKLHREDGPAIVWPDGKEHWWYKEGKLHRENGPAVEYAGGAKYWWRNGKLHREDGPAVESANGTKEWFLDGIGFSSEGEWKAELEKRNMKTIQVKDSCDIPSGFTGIVGYASGTKAWYKEGLLHREDGPAIEYADGTKEWYVNGKLHREDGPAIEWPDGTKEWLIEGKLHREDGPAAEYPSGTKFWYKEGKLHRENGPAIQRADGTKEWHLDGTRFSFEEWKVELEKRNMKTIRVNNSYDIPYGFTGIAEYFDGVKEWYKEGKLHREDGPAVELANGDKFWYKDGKYHREDGPAIEWSDGTKQWIVEGKYHREDGPACEYSNGSKSWYLNGTGFSSEAAWKTELEKLRGEKQTPAILSTRSVLRLKEGQEVPAGYTGLVQWKNGVSASYTNGVGEII